MLMSMEYDDRVSSRELMNIAKQLHTQYRTFEENNEDELEVAWDDASGATLDPKEVRKARAEEIRFVTEMGLYEKVQIKQCHERTGKATISVRWVDINKGDQEKPDYRSRLVAREVNTHKRDDLFAATPPLEALQVILSMAATANRGEMVMVNDVGRAFVDARAQREVYVQLPNEDLKIGEWHLCGRLKYSMYGTRDAAQNWHEEYSNQLISIWFKQGRASPCTFYYVERGIRTYVHGDDYVSIGKIKELKWMQGKLESAYAIQIQILGPGKDNLQQLRILNRIITWSDVGGIGYEADPRHVELILKQLQLAEAKTVSTPGTKEEGRTGEDHGAALDDKETTNYRALVSRCNYLAPDRLDMAFTVKGLARAMAKPTRGDLQKLKRLGRYLKGKPR